MSGLQHASENLNRSLDTDLRVRKFGYLLVIFLILVIGTWSACAPLDIAGQFAPASAWEELARVLLAAPCDLLPSVTPTARDLGCWKVRRPPNPAPPPAPGASRPVHKG